MARRAYDVGQFLPRDAYLGGASRHVARAPNVFWPSGTRSFAVRRRWRRPRSTWTLSGRGASEEHRSDHLPRHQAERLRRPLNLGPSRPIPPDPPLLAPAKTGNAADDVIAKLEQDRGLRARPARLWHRQEGV
jgi:hypothetical protein